MENSNIESPDAGATNRFNTRLKTSLPTLRSDYDSFIKSNSDAIRAARVLCIFSMCYVHIHIAGSNINPFIYEFMRDVLGRSSVPLLSVISGLLMVGYFGKPFRDVVLLRCKSLALPMMAWGAAGWLVAYILGDVDSLGVNDLVPIWEKGHLDHLAFLRDLFFLVLLTPALMSLLKKSQLSLILLVAIGFWAPLEPLMLRPQILPFYAFGLFLGLYDISAPRFLNWFGPALFVVITIAIVFISLRGYLLDNLLLRPITAWVFWLLALAIARSHLMSFFVRIEPSVFLLFLSHLTVGRIITGIYSKIGLNIDTFFWLITPAICLGIAIVGKSMLSSRLTPRLLSTIVTGK